MNEIEERTWKISYAGPTTPFFAQCSGMDLAPLETVIADGLTEGESIAFLSTIGLVHKALDGSAFWAWSESEGAKK